MRFAVAGAGAIGGYVGACLARAGEEVTLFARGPHLAAMREHGLRVVSGDDAFEVRPTITGDLAALAGAEVIFLGVKAHALPDLAPRIAPLLGGATTIVSMQNGIPWWSAGGVQCVDPGGVIARSIPRERVVGSIAYFAAELEAPGVIRHVEGNRLSLGEPDGERSERSRRIAQALIAAGIRAPITTRINEEIWVKLLGNASLNPISALTGATIAVMLRDARVAAVIRDVMAEVQAVARALGIELPITIEQRIAGAEKVGEHKTSMLQDLESGRPLELDATSGAVVELGVRLGVPTPVTRAIHAAAALLDRTRRRA